MCSLESYSGLGSGSKKEKRFDGRIGIKGSETTFFDKKELLSGFMRTNQENSKVSAQESRSQRII